MFAEEDAIEQVAGEWQPADHEAEEGAVFVRHITSRCIHRIMDEAGTHSRRVATVYLLSNPAVLDPVLILWVVALPRVIGSGTEHRVCCAAGTRNRVLFP